MTKLVVNFHNSAIAPKKYKASNHVADRIHDLGPMAVDCRNESTGVTELCTPIPVIVWASVTHTCRPTFEREHLFAPSYTAQ